MRGRNGYNRDFCPRFTAVALKYAHAVGRIAAFFRANLLPRVLVAGSPADGGAATGEKKQRKDDGKTRHHLGCCRGGGGGSNGIPVQRQAIGESYCRILTSS